MRRTCQQVASRKPASLFFVLFVLGFFSSFLLLQRWLYSSLESNVFLESSFDVSVSHLGNHHFLNHPGQQDDPSQTISAGLNKVIRPTITWLMSYPNSGTSYTMTNTQQVSNLSTITNYAAEVPSNEILYPIHHKIRVDSTNGPWQLNQQLHLPSERVLCKTHCDGYFHYFPLNRSVHTLDSFFDGCQRTIARGALPDEYLHYDSTNLVSSAIHLIRNPFDNIISRMHLGMRLVTSLSHLTASELETMMGTKVVTMWSRMTAQELETFMDTKEAFDEWSDHVHERFWMTQNVPSHMEISEETLALLQHDPRPYLDIPCYAEFFRYTQWHNMALEVIRSRNLSFITIRYDDYVVRHSESVDRILNFLGQKRVFDPIPFEHGKMYQDFFFNCSMQHKIKQFIKTIASKETWSLLRPYFKSPFTAC